MLVQVISSTTRAGRFSEKVARWVTGHLAACFGIAPTTKPERRQKRNKVFGQPDGRKQKDRLAAVSPESDQVF